MQVVFGWVKVAGRFLLDWQLRLDLSLFYAPLTLPPAWGIVVATACRASFWLFFFFFSGADYVIEIKKKLVFVKQ